MIRTAIKKELKERKLTVTKLSEETGVRNAALSQFINKGKNLSVENLEKVLNYLELKLNP